MLQRLGHVVFLGLLILPLGAQTLSVSVDRIDLKMLQGGPLPTVSKFTLNASNSWTADTSDVDVVSVDKKQGTGSAIVTVVPVAWRNPGKFTANVTVTSGGQSRVIPVTLEVVARSAPRFTYIDGPKSCTDATGFAPGNAALCTVANEKPPGNFAPPDVGQTYRDPNFGALVRVVAGVRSLHAYSTPSPVSAKSKYVLLGTNDAFVIVELLTGKRVRDLTSFGLEGSVWDATNENYLYGFSGARILKFDVSTGTTSVVVNYAGRFQSITPNGTAEKSKDNWLAFYAPTERQICTVDISTATTYCGAALAAGISLDFATMSKGIDPVTGKRYVIGIVNGPFLIYSVNKAENRLDLEGRGPENVLMESGNRDGICDAGESCIAGGHSDTLEDSKGYQYLVGAMEGQSPCEYALYSIQLNRGNQMGLPSEFGGGLKRLMPMFRCGAGDQWVDFHTACATQAPDCVISTTMSGFDRARNPNDTSAPVRTPYMGEIFVVHDNGTEIRRLAEHRSLQFTNEESNGYWSAPRAAISADGGYVVATSNFGSPNQHRVIAIATGFAGVPKLAEGNPVLNAASFESKLSPGMLATVFGSNLTNRTASANFPLPLELAGVKIKVANLNAPIFSTTPDQVSFLIPQQVPTSGTVNLEVTTTDQNTGLAAVLNATLPNNTIAPLAPAIFAKAIPGSPWNGALLFDKDWNQLPLTNGDYGILFALGLGPTSPSVPLGEAGPLVEPLARLVKNPDVYINDVPQEVIFAGFVPGMSSVYQVVFRITASTPKRPDFDWIWLNVQGVDSTRLLMDLRSPA